MESLPPLRFTVLALVVFGAIASSASCLLTSNFDGLTGNETTSTGGGSTGSHASSTGGTSAGGGGSGPGTSTSSSGMGGTSASTGGTGGSGGSGGSGGGPCMQRNIGGAFPATCVLDDFNRANGDPGLNWLMESPGDYSILNHQLVTPTPAMPGDQVRPGTTLWSPALGPTQEMFITLSQFTAADYEIELILKAQSTPMECGAIQVSYHQGTLDVSYCEINGTFIGMDPGPASVTLHPGDQFGARATVDGKLLAYQNGHLIGTWDSKPFSAYAAGGRVGIEMDGLVDKLFFDDFGGGGQ